MVAGFTFKKFLYTACITSLFLGLFGATPGFTSYDFHIQRVLNVFLIVTSYSFFLWIMNIGLLWAGNRKNFLKDYRWRFAVSVILCCITVFLLLAIIPHGPPPPSTQHHPGEPRHLQRFNLFPVVQGLSINIIIVILMELMMLRETKSRVDNENEQLKLANLEAKNNQLKQQLHPHFLFNSLSTLRSLISRSPETAADYLDKLAELLRFSTTNSQQALVLLKEEVELCTNYLNMQTTRFGEALHFDINIPETLQQKGKVPIYSLQQLAENAIKHNVLTKEQPLKITIACGEDSRRLEVKNNLQPKQTIEASSGVGLANLSERYILLGGDDILVTKKDGNFSVSIKILGHEGNNN